MNTLTVTLIILGISIVISFLYGLFTRNYSTVDRLWSILPPMYVLVWMRDYSHNPRYVIASCIIILWGVRLTANFALKGGYRFSVRKGFTGEDYRWAVLREKIGNRILFELFNLVFISAFQLVLIFAFTLPVYYYGRITRDIQPVEYLLFLLHLLFLALETIADIQQLRFYRRRNLSPWKEQPRYRLGFNTFGLWRFVRHPNYACEMAQWVVVHLYLLAASHSFHWSGIGAVALVALFAGSTNFTESITEKKYPEYNEWKKVTSAWIPVQGLLIGKKERAEYEKICLPN